MRTVSFSRVMIGALSSEDMFEALTGRAFAARPGSGVSPSGETRITSGSGEPEKTLVCLPPTEEDVTIIDPSGSTLED